MSRLVIASVLGTFCAMSCAVLLRALSNRAADNAQLDDIDWLAEYRIPIVTATGATIRLRVAAPNGGN